MALAGKGSKVAPTQDPAAKFEDDSAPAPAATQEAAPSVAPGQPSADVETTRAVTKAQTTAVATGGTFGNVFKQFEEVITDIEFGTVARIVGSNGRIVAKKDSKKIELGEQIRITLVSYGISYQISPGDDSDKGKAAVRYSKDGVKIDGTGESVDAYLEKLRTTDGFTKASLKKYTSLVGIIEEVDSQKPEAQAFVGDMAEVSLSPTAGKAFNGHMLQVSVKKARGLLPADYNPAALYVRSDVRNNGSKDYTALAVSDK